MTSKRLHFDGNADDESEDNNSNEDEDKVEEEEDDDIEEFTQSGEDVEGN